MLNLMCVRLLVSKTTLRIGRRRWGKRVVYVVVVTRFEDVVANVVVIVIFAMSDEIFESVDDASASGHYSLFVVESNGETQSTNYISNSIVTSQVCSTFPLLSFSSRRVLNDALGA